MTAVLPPRSSAMFASFDWWLAMLQEVKRWSPRKLIGGAMRAPPDLAFGQVVAGDQPIATNSYTSKLSSRLGCRPSALASGLTHLDHGLLETSQHGSGSTATVQVPRPAGRRCRGQLPAEGPVRWC